MRKLLSVLSSTLQGGVRGGLLLLLVASVSAIYASDIKVGGIWYDFDSSTKTASVTYRGYDYDSYYGEYSGTVIIPETVTYNGTTYSVTSIGDNAFSYCSSLTSITIPNSVTSIGKYAFEGCSSLTSVTIGNSVTSIGDWAFEGCSSLTKTNYTGDIAGWCNIKFSDAYANPIGYSHNFYINNQEIKDLVIPNSVTSIGNYAFFYCYSLTSVTIGESVTSIGDYAFNGCSSLTSVTIPNSVTSIGSYAFYDCSSLTSVTIPESVTSIGEWAFRGCSSLTSVTIPESVTSIGYYAFNKCSSLTSVTIPNSVTSIEAGTFSGCSSLTSITIPNSVTSIGFSAFSGCSSLTSITIPESVTSIGDRAFMGCNSISSIVVNEDNTIYDSRENCNAIIETATNTLIAGWQNTTIPNNVTSIGGSAFSGCSSLTSITIPNSVTSIGNYAFSSCSSLTSVTIPNSVTSIGEYAFKWCSSLTSVTIGKSVTSIGYAAFYDCSSLTSVTINSDAIVNKAYSSNSNISHIFGSQITEYIIGESVTSIGYAAFCACDSLTSVTIGESVTSIGDYAFNGCSSLTSVTIPNSVTSIGYAAFYDCSSLTSVTIPNSVTSIGDYAFADCPLTSVTIPNSVTSIGYAAFYDCSSLTSVTIGESVTSIGDYAFADCSSLTSVTIGKSVTSIGDRAFEYCSSLTKTNYTGDIAGWCNIKFEDYDANPMYYSHNFYINDQEIKDLVIPNSVTSIGDYAFVYCSKLTSVTIGESVTSIGDYAFYGCSTLTSVTIPESVTSIGYYAFENCSKLTSVTINSNAIVSKNYSYSSNISDIFSSQVTEYIIGDDVKGIGDYAFYGCSKLTSVTIGESVTSIGDYAFYDCSSLTSVTIPESVTSIGNEAFYGCTSLTKTNYTGDIAGWCNIKFGEETSNPMCYSHNFYINDQEIKNLVIPNSVTSIGNWAFYECYSLTSVTIGESVTSIGSYAFNKCSSLTSVTIPESVTSIGYYAFYGCSSLPVEDNLRYADTYLVEAVNKNWSTTYYIKEGTKWIGDAAFEGCSNWISVPIPNSVTSIGSSAFSGCYSLPYITIPESVTSIGDEAFYGCSSLTSVTIPNSVTSIGNYAFENCSKLTSVTIGESVEHIGICAFQNCSSLTSITIPESVTSIGGAAFYDCSSLTSITCEAATPPTIGGTYTFDGVSKSIPVYVPCGCVEAYKAASGWEDFTNIQESLAEYSIEVYVNDTIMGSAKVDKNTLCDACISATPNLGYHFVQWNDGNTENPRTLELTQDTILTAEFAQSFFGQCGDNLYWSYDETAKTISITGSGKMYDYTADTQPWLLFKEQIVEVTTTNTVTSIGTSAFEGCARLGKISLGTGLKEIAANAFAGCTRLYDVYCYATNPPFAEQSSFANYNVYLYVPCESQRNYTLDVVWGNFKFIECIESEDVTTEGVVVTPSTNEVTITWPTEGNADTYTIVIKKGDTVFCTLTFSADGQLLNIAFAPGRDGNHPAQYAEQAGNGYRFTVTGLEEGTQYAYNITTKDAANKTIATYSGEFTTMGGTTTDMDNIQSPMSNCQKLLHNGQLLIIRDAKTYHVMGQEM